MFIHSQSITMNILFSQFTLIIPTFERKTKLLRTLEYYKNIAHLNLIICDGSQSHVLPIKSCHCFHLHIKFFYLACLLLIDLSILELIKTPFVLIGNDEDLFVPVISKNQFHSWQIMLSMCAAGSILTLLSLFFSFPE